MPHIRPATRTRPSPRRALLWGVAIFLLGQAVLSALIQTRWRIVRDPVYFVRLQNLQQKRAAAPAGARTVLFLGTSRFELGVQTRLLERQLSDELGRPVVVANWGTGGWGVFRTLMALRRLEREGVRPDLVLVEVMPVQLGKKALDTEEPLLTGNELDAGDVRLLLRHQPDATVEGDRLQAHLVPVLGHRRNLLRLLRPSLVRVDGRPLEHLGLDAPATWPAEVRTRVVADNRYWFGVLFREFALNPRPIGVLDDLLGGLKKAGIPTAVIVMPEGPAFRSLYPSWAWPQVEGCLDELTRRYQVPLVNLRESIDDEEEFNDSHHLTGKGAERFSKRLGRDVLVPLLRRLEAMGF